MGYRLAGLIVFWVCIGIASAQGVVESTDCVEQPYGFVTSCGYVTLPQDYDNPDKGHVEIFYSQIKSDSNTPKSDPLVYLVGGPGSSGTQLLVSSFQAYLRPFADERDIIVIDQRGTGYSNPSLYCREALFRIDDILQSTIDTHAVVVLDVLAQCHNRLSNRGIHLETFHSKNISRDIVNVLLSLGYEEWNLVGVSYGSRLALTMMRDYPQYLRSVILDSVYPLQADLYIDSYYNGERALAVLFEACANDVLCNEQYPNLDTVFYELYARLNDEPQIGIIEPAQLGPLEIEVSGYRFYDWIFSWLYSVQSIEHIPRLIYAMDSGDVTLVTRVGATYEASLTSLSLGMHYTVQCQEEFISDSNRDYELIIETYPHLDGYLRYLVEGIGTVGRLCDIWQTEARSSVANAPVVSDIPTLLLSGQFDPITPPFYADIAHETLTMSYNYVLPYVGHGVLRSDRCAVEIARTFIDAPSSTPDTNCIAGTLPLIFR